MAIHEMITYEINMSDTIDDESAAPEQGPASEEVELDRYARMSGAELSRAIDVEIAKLS